MRRVKCRDISCGPCTYPSVPSSTSCAYAAGSRVGRAPPAHAAPASSRSASAGPACAPMSAPGSPAGCCHAAPAEAAAEAATSSTAKGSMRPRAGRRLGAGASLPLRPQARRSPRLGAPAPFTRAGRKAFFITTLVARLRGLGARPGVGGACHRRAARESAEGRPSIASAAASQPRLVPPSPPAGAPRRAAPPFGIIFIPAVDMDRIQPRGFQLAAFPAARMRAEQGDRTGRSHGPPAAGCRKGPWMRGAPGRAGGCPHAFPLLSPRPRQAARRRRRRRPALPSPSPGWAAATAFAPRAPSPRRARPRGGRSARRATGARAGRTRRPPPPRTPSFPLQSGPRPSPSIRRP